MKSLKIPSIGAFPLLELPIADQMQDFINQQLDYLNSDAEKTIDSWDIPRKLEEKGLTEFRFKEIIGCDARCPFCKVPCDAHSGSRTQGNHSATLHRPQGLAGTTHTNPSQLVSVNCSIRITSQDHFGHPEEPTWTINPDPDPDLEKYWQFIFAKYNEEFAQFYNAKPTRFPRQWTKHTLDEVLEILN